VTFDIIIIGAGVIGCAIARELSMYDYKILVLEKEDDVCSEASKANSGIIHAGYDAKHTTLKARLNLEGNKRMHNLCKELDIPFQQNGSLVVGYEEADIQKLHELHYNGIKNGVEELKLLSGVEAEYLEPNLRRGVKAALYAPTAGIICPFEMTLAFAQNAVTNGVEFGFCAEVIKISKVTVESEHLQNHSYGYVVYTRFDTFYTRIIINAAGAYADQIHNMVAMKKIKIDVIKGEYCLYDKRRGREVTRTIFSLPTHQGKGVLVTRTIHNNLLVGPTAVSIEDKEGVDTTIEGVEEILYKGSQLVPTINEKDMITTFAGLRSCCQGGDFIIEECKEAEGFIDVLGICSPGLTSAPAIGLLVTEIVLKKICVYKKVSACTTRKRPLSFCELTEIEKQQWIKSDKAYGRVICRCETITEGDVIAAIHGVIGAKSLDGIKRRIRAQSGRCQGGFCTPALIEILARELHIPVEEVTKKGRESFIVST